MATPKKNTDAPDDAPTIAPKGDTLADDEAVALDDDLTTGYVDPSAAYSDDADLAPADDALTTDDSDDEQFTGSRLDDGSEGNATLPVEANGTLLEAPAAAVLDPGPPPITPASSQQQHHDRVGYENLVNAQVEQFLIDNRAALTDAFLAGGTVELNVTLPETEDEYVDDRDDDDLALTDEYAEIPAK